MDLIGKKLYNNHLELIEVSGTFQAGEETLYTLKGKNTLLEKSDILFFLERQEDYISQLEEQHQKAIKEREEEEKRQKELVKKSVLKHNKEGNFYPLLDRKTRKIFDDISEVNELIDVSINDMLINEGYQITDDTDKEITIIIK